MENPFRKKIASKQGNIEYAPDSSPEAWDHYKKVYGETVSWDRTYDISNKTIFRHKLVKGQHLYTNEGVEEGHNQFTRLYALPNNLKPINCAKNYFGACNRLSGETDFNFNDEHFPRLEKLLIQKENKQKLEYCKRMHYTLVNFSLMQTVGNMQGFKGTKCDDDRLDKFLSVLFNYYNTSEENRDKTELIQTQKKEVGLGLENINSLKEYLNSFQSFADYCKKVYFIEGEELRNKLVESGKKALDTEDRVVEYMELALEFWESKESKYINQYFPRYVEVYHSLFCNGGEAYTYDQLREEFVNRGFISEDFQDFLNLCIAKNWLHDCGNETYIR